MMRKLWKMKGPGRILCMLVLVAALLMGCQGDVADDANSGLTQNKINNEIYNEKNGEDSHDENSEGENHTASGEIVEDGTYTTKEDVAEYIYKYQHLPSNFIKKSEAKVLGWENVKGNLHEVAPGKSIGGDKFGNYEGLLPEAEGRQYYECDINYDGGYRGSERIIYSNDGLIYYTEDHYETFELLYGEE